MVKNTFCVRAVLYNAKGSVVGLLLRFSPGYVQTLPSKYLWIRIAILDVCLELEMLQEIPAMCYIIPLTCASLTYPICKQDVKRGMRRLRTIFSKTIWGLEVKPLAPGAEFVLLCCTPKNSTKRKDKYLHPQQHECCMDEAEDAECISKHWEILRKGTSAPLPMSWMRILAQTVRCVSPGKIGVSFLSLRVWICSSPFPAAIGLLWEPQEFLTENQTFKMVGEAFIQTPTWISVSRKTRELVSNN